MSAQAGPPESPDRLTGRLRDALAAPDAAPDGLVDATMAAVRATRQDRPALRLGLLAGAAAVLVVATVGVLAVAIPAAIRPTATPAPSTAVTSPAPTSASPTATPDFPATVLGLDAISVSDALAVRDAAGGPGSPYPLAVKGWLTGGGVILCPHRGPIDDLEARCPAAFVWLTQDREDLLTVTAGGASGHPPTGPALNPRFLGGVTAPEVPASPGAGGMRDPDPIPVVLVGHWNDGRAAFCTAAAAATCKGEFVVDGVAWARGQPVAPMLLGHTSATASRTADDVVEAAIRALPGWTVASLALYLRGGLPEADPRLLDRDVPVPGDIVWMARMIRRGEEPVTLLVSDLDGSTAQLPAWPVRGPVVDGLTGETAVLPSVGVVTAATCDDRTMVGGILAWSDGPTIRVVGAGETRLATFAGGRLLARRVDGEVALIQAGGHVVVTPGWHVYTACNVLTGAGAVGAIVDVDGEPLLAYQLSCGGKYRARDEFLLLTQALDRETCLDRAAAVEEFVASQYPGRKLVSLTISDPCGTYNALLDDNTRLAVVVDCLLPTPTPSPSPSAPVPAPGQT